MSAKRAFVVADTHGNWQGLMGLLRQEDLTDEKFRRDSNVTTVHLGDLANCVRESNQDDLVCLSKAKGYFDLLLPGNHEHPYWPGYIPKFSGFQYYPTVASAIFDAGLTYRAAFAFGGVLVTHAGLARKYEGIYETADEAAESINALWETDPNNALFSEIGMRRGGVSAFGGILWSDWQEAKARDFTQLIGHTPGKKVRLRDHSTTETQILCIDLGAKHRDRPLAGAWIKEDGTITARVYNPKSTPVEGELEEGE